MRKVTLWTLVLFTILAGSLAGCGAPEPTAVPATDIPAKPVLPTETTAPAGEPTSGALESPLPTPAATTGDTMESPLPTPPAGEVQTLRLALLPVLDVLPYHVAQQNGYFEQVGVEVEGIPVKSGQERDTLMQTGQVDGMLTDLISPVLFNRDGEHLKAVRTTRKVYPGAPIFRLLAAPGSAVQSPADLVGVEIGIAQNTVIEYITQRMLENAGLTPDQIATQEVSAIPMRFELLINGQLPAATLPDPLASGAIAAGAVPVMDDTSVPELSQSILAFSDEALATKPEAVRRLLLAWEMAVGEINAHPEDYYNLLIQVGRVPESVQGTFQMPPFPEASVPTPDQLADVVSWALAKGLIESDIPYEWMVADSYLP